MLSTFGPRTRRDAQKALLGFGDAFAGRGADINDDDPASCGRSSCT